MPPIPAPATTEILSLTRELMDKATTPTAFELARMDRLIRKLENADSQASLSFRGLYYALQGDGPSSVQWHKLALSHDSKHPDAYRNCVISLLRLNKPAEAARIALRGITETGEDPALIDSLLRAAYYSDNHGLIAEWLPKYEKLTKERHDVSFWLEEDAEDEADLAANWDEYHKGPGISWEDLKKELGL